MEEEEEDQEEEEEKEEEEEEPGREGRCYTYLGGAFSGAGVMRVYIIFPLL